MSYVIAGEGASAIWSGKYIVFHKKLGGHLVRQDFTIYLV